MTRPVTTDPEVPEVAAEEFPLVRLRMDPELWQRFEKAVLEVEIAAGLDPRGNRSANLRQYVRWMVGDVNIAPQRPDHPIPRDEPRPGKEDGDGLETRP